jgi:hypothetical protein
METAQSDQEARRLIFRAGILAAAAALSIYAVSRSPQQQSIQTPEPSASSFTREQVRRFRGDIAMTGAAGSRSEWGTWAYLGWDAKTRAEFRAKYRAEGYTHVALNLALDYDDFYPRFDFRSDPPHVRAGLQELIDAGLVPVLSAAQAETYGRFERFDLARALKDLDSILPRIVDLVPVAWSGWESSDFMTAEQHRAILRKLRQHLPNAYIGVQPGRSPSGGLIHPGSKSTDAARFWGELRGVVDVLFFEPSMETFEADDWRERLYDELMGASARVHGRLRDVPSVFPFPPHRSTDPYRERWTRAAPVAKVDVVYFEGPAYQRWSSEKKREAGAIALKVPGVVGCMDGCPRER